MAKFFVALAALSMMAASIPASARTCTTTCHQNGNSQTCQQHCY